MKNTRKFVFLAVLVFTGSFVNADVPDEQSGNLAIGTIETAGNVRITSSRILSRVRSRAGQTFDASVASEDVKRIAELKGVDYCYYNTTTAEGKIKLTFVVVERNLVRSIKFLGNTGFKAAKLSKKLGFKIGSHLDLIQAEEGRIAIEEFYHEKGYAFVRVILDAADVSSGKLIYKISEGPRVKIAYVRFSGNSAVSSKKLKRKVSTKDEKFWLWPSYYVDEVIEKDVTGLQNIYYDRGFLDTGVMVKREFNADKSLVDITFVIDEGEIYRVERIIFEGNSHFNDEQLSAKLKVMEGQVYNKRKAEKDARRLAKLYRENGYIDVEIERGLKFVSASTVEVEFRIKEGERFRIGQINITGNEETQDRVVRRVLDEQGFQPGNWYNADIARGDGSGELEKDIRRSTLMQAATITASGDIPGQRDATVNVIEGQTGSVMIGAGVASDSGVIGQLVYEQRNFDITDHPESFKEFITGRAFKGAGQNLRIALQPGTEVSEYSVNFTEPYFQNQPVSLNVMGSSYERWRESYNEKRTKGYVGFEKRLKNKWRKSISFRLENVDLSSVDIDAPKEVIDDKENNSLAGLRVGIGRNMTDSKYNPSEGYSFNAGYEQVGGDYTFGVLRGTFRYYKTLFEDLAERKTILATKLYGGAIVGDAPVYEKFYAGGQGSLRGFDYRGVSTRGLQTGVASPQRKDPIGSDWIFLANAEVIVPLAGDNLSALFFVDSGIIDTGNYRAAIGTGIQIMIPQWFGPVPMRFEIAVPFMKSDGDETQVFSFSVGRLF